MVVVDFFNCSIILSTMFSISLPYYCFCTSLKSVNVLKLYFPLKVESNNLRKLFSAGLNLTIGK